VLSKLILLPNTLQESVILFFTRYLLILQKSFFPLIETEE